jgi:hypothetical protein
VVQAHPEEFFFIYLSMKKELCEECSLELRLERRRLVGG